MLSDNIGPLVDELRGALKPFLTSVPADRDTLMETWGRQLMSLDIVLRPLIQSPDFREHLLKIHNYWAEMEERLSARTEFTAR